MKKSRPSLSKKKNPNPVAKPSRSRESQQWDSEQAIKAIVNTAKSYGADSLLLALVGKGDGLITTHLQNISVASGMNSIITLFNQLCDFEVQAAERMGDNGRARDIEQLRAAFLGAVKTFNASRK